jgi:hypothetical protein
MLVVTATVSLAGAEAHAAPLLSTEILQRTLESFDLGSLCARQLTFAIGFDPDLHESGNAGVACQSLRGVGFAVLALLALVMIALGRMRLQTENKRLEVAQRLVEQGMDPPPELLMGPARNDLRKGVVLLFAGAGVFASGLLLVDRGLAAAGLVPEFIGVGYLVSYWLTSRRPHSSTRGRL